MQRAEFGSAVSAIMTMPYFALIVEITPLSYVWPVPLLDNENHMHHVFLAPQAYLYSTSTRNLSVLPGGLWEDQNF